MRRLVDSVLVTNAGDQVILSTGSRDGLSLRGDLGRVEQAVSLLRGGVDESDIIADRVLEDLVVALTHMGWLTSEPPQSPAESTGRLARQHGYLTLFAPDARELQSRIAACSIMLVGVGGIGAVAAQHLGAAGVGRIVAVDPDVVELHNLNRQLPYTTRDVGVPKVQALKARLRDFAPETNVVSVRRRVTDVRDLDGVPPVDLVLVGADQPAELADLVWRWCLGKGVAMSRASVGHEHGFWGPLLSPRDGHCHLCFEEAREAGLSRERWLEGGHGPTPWSFGATNTVIAAWAVHDIVQYIATSGCPTLNRRAQLDFSRGELHFFDGPRCTCNP
ncbi:HesA/MoeB/ThiF family protein [Nonomuraea rhizosphaerae]|uniref:HesA/MoeB/ThiF family protein n=1 Tax=Nonomuraea rhizosphaerae TaxID=2665663 RepID=UPI001C605F39|nr:ThiF family adenylyltransferase [Nonomuraea rhizosphaerae]